MQLKLYRPLNTLVVSLETELGFKFFLIDTGCSVSFADHARVVVKGSWYSDQEISLARAPFSLAPLSERLGIPIEGFIGLRDLIKQWRVYLDFDRGEILLGGSAPHFPSDLGEESTGFKLEKINGSPIGLRGELAHALTSDQRDLKT